MRCGSDFLRTFRINEADVHSSFYPLYVPPPPAIPNSPLPSGFQPTLPATAINPSQAYLSNRIRPKGVVEKCTFCLQRTRAGKYPACLEVCPTGARVFGNLLDPKSEISYILQNKRVYILKEDVGTRPRFYYFFDR